MKKVLYIVGYVLSFMAVVSLLGLAEANKHQITFDKLNVDIDTKDNNYFVDKTEIEDKVFSYGYRIGQEPLVDIDIKALEKSFDEMPVVRNAEVYSTLDGSVTVEIQQRLPIARIFTRSGESFYLDTEGYIMPLSSKYTARVIVANGFIPAGYTQIAGKQFSDSSKLDMTDKAQRQLYEIYTLASTFENVPFWDSQFKQVYFRQDGDIELVPSVGNHLVRIGGVESLDESLTKLMILYKEGLSKIGWNEYTYINLKYKNQIVCEKR